MRSANMQFRLETAPMIQSIRWKACEEITAAAHPKIKSEISQGRLELASQHV